jgi:hypothetical protein
MLTYPRQAQAKIEKECEVKYLEAEYWREAVTAALARHCAPVLLGKKPAALFVQPTGWDGMQMDTLAVGGMRFYTCAHPHKRSLILAYRPPLLAQALSIPAAKTALLEMGYPNRGMNAMLGELRRRLFDSQSFPHEIGFFLGYPPEDVLGFIRHQGRHCKLCGKWKVYHDTEAAGRIFAEYARCERVLARHIQNGGTIFQYALSVLKNTIGS